MGLGLASVDMSLGLPEVPPTPASRSDIGQRSPPLDTDSKGQPLGAQVTPLAANGAISGTSTAPAP